MTQVRGACHENTLILGMHRSGTSSLAGMLADHGLYMGDVRRNGRYNHKGSLEGYASGINEALFVAHGGSWKRPTVPDRPPVGLLFGIEKLRLQMTIDLLRSGGRHWGVKDPRMVFCRHLWTDPGTRLVGTFRHPHRVVASLRHRHPDEAEIDWERLWYLYNRELLAAYEQSPFPIVNFGWEPGRYCGAVKRTSRRLQLDGVDDGFFDDRLRHHEAEGSIDNPEHRRLYERLVAIAESQEEDLRVADAPPAEARR